ncbi:cytochrome c6 PetJ [Pseudanabaena sp. PCC 6802]|uniref:cytochrome c6 PetJ n=1 Tax=Pseudanabaena sp. PCC 6802 TaxID=118173 RepID=UPI00034A334A|nr:c-type cytochrome [Pseudanabaena sp. PCC 6802]
MIKTIARLLSILFLTIAALNLTCTSPAIAADLARGAEIFNANCAGCHANGGNIVRRNKTLKLKALSKFGMDSVAAIAEIVAKGKNNMSAYKERLSDREIEDVATYVLTQAESGWRN